MSCWYWGAIFLYIYSKKIKCWRHVNTLSLIHILRTWRRLRDEEIVYTFIVTFNKVLYVISYTSVFIRYIIHVISYTSVFIRYIIHVISYTSVFIRYIIHVCLYTLYHTRLSLYVISYTSVFIRYIIHVISYTSVFDLMET